MYGFKEKNKYFNELRNSAAAEADLSLLQLAAPAHPKLKMFARNPQRYANDILYTLLDFKPKDEIRLNRRECEKAKEENAEVLEQENQELKEELETEQEARVEAEDRAEQAEQALEEEKKKEPTKVAPKSKSTKSTRKSTGKTSKTKTSK